MNSSREKVALVTGGNRGLGLEVCRQLAQRKIQVILTSRNSEKGKKAQEALAGEGLKVFFHPLDVTRSEDVDQLYHTIEKDWGHLDILINNAGVLLDSARSSPNPEAASFFHAKLDTIRSAMETNTYGPILMIQKFFPLMKRHHYGRIVNLSSGMGQLSSMEGRWPSYRISKTALNAVTCIVAAETQGSGILINSVCPGWVRTDMGGSEADLSIQEGADTIVWLATLPDNGPTGKFFRERKEIPW